jgi:quinone-modifying oxidoreductase subunit QmoC
MASNPVIQTSSEFREAFFDRGGENAARCYQCATCSSVCELAPANAPFPRRQILWAQWGLQDRLLADPGPWLCHQCNDCSVRCPREVNPGDIMASIRAMVVEKMAFPGFLGSLVGNVKKTWPLLVLAPIIFWIVLLGVNTGLAPVHPHHDLQPSATLGQFFYDAYVPHSLIYAVYFTAVGWVGLALFMQGRKFWAALDTQQKRQGTLIGALVGVFTAIALHSKFSECERGVSKRRWGHFLVMWGFVGAAITSGFAVVYLYGDTVWFSWFFKILPGEAPGYPVEISHWVKWLGNISAVALVLGGLLLWLNRRNSTDKLVGSTTPFDRFFLWIVLAVIGTGVFTEIFRFVPGITPMIGFGVYIIHLGVVLCLFLTLPYSKFAHILYRTLAMAHERLTVDTGQS